MRSLGSYSISAAPHAVARARLDPASATESMPKRPSTFARAQAIRYIVSDQPPDPDNLGMAGELFPAAESAL